jgi:DksA/TraR C4-type zinc finger protein
MEMTKLCNDCGEPIPAGRLEAQPSTTLCRDCKALSENRSKKGLTCAVDARDHAMSEAAFWVYENWRARGHRVRVHASQCRFCNGGRGLSTGTRPDNGLWHGPFDALERATAFANSLDTASLECSCCAWAAPVGGLPRAGAAEAAVPQGELPSSTAGEKLGVISAVLAVLFALPLLLVGALKKLGGLGGRDTSRRRPRA